MVQGFKRTGLGEVKTANQAVGENLKRDNDLAFLSPREGILRIDFGLVDPVDDLSDVQLKG